MSVFSFGWMRGRRLAYDYDGSFCLFFSLFVLFFFFFWWPFGMYLRR